MTENPVVKLILRALAFVALITTATAPPPNGNEESAWLGELVPVGDVLSAKAVNTHRQFQYQPVQQPDHDGLTLFQQSTSGGNSRSRGDPICGRELGIQIDEDPSMTFCRARVISLTNEGTPTVRMYLGFTGAGEGQPKCRLEIPIKGVPQREISRNSYYRRSRNTLTSIRVSSFMRLRSAPIVSFKFDWLTGLVGAGVTLVGIDNDTGLFTFETRPIVVTVEAMDSLRSILKPPS